MKITNVLLNRFMPFTKVMAISACSALTLSACFGGSSDDVVVDDGGGSSTTSAFNFTEGNTEAAAKLAANTLSFFPAFAVVNHEVISTLPVLDPNNPPLDLGLCSNTGSSILSWNDADNDSKLSAGDSAQLTYTNCDIDGIATGTVDYAFSSVDLDDPLTNHVASTVTINLSIYDAPDTTTYIANFENDLSIVKSTNLYTNTSTADDASGQKITAIENGTQRYQFGCFEVTESYSPPTPGTYGLAPAVGVINSDNKIMSLVGGPPLNFVAEVLESGTKPLYSLAIPECASIGVPTGVGDSDGSHMDIEALGGGYVTLHTYDETNAVFYTVDTTWDALLID